mmetsp:Transcript_7487/g.20229  ORF Transcript_7487/g.20229 Transcript_7487/m.20229 type:complete len:1155 (+) Transcript_7487:2178-5642(+)
MDHRVLQHRRVLRGGPPEGGEAVLVREVILHDLLVDALVVELEGLLVGDSVLLRVVAVHRPVAAVHRLLLLLHHGLVPEAVAPIHASGVGDDDRGAIVGLGLLEGLHRLVDVRRKRNGGHVGVLVHHGDRAQVLLLPSVAASCHLLRDALGGGLGELEAGVGVALGVKNQDVDVLARGQHVVQAAEADVVGPTVAADDPMRRRDEHVGAALHGPDEVRRGELLGLRGEEALQLIEHHVARVRAVGDVEPLLQGGHQFRGGDGLRLQLSLVHELPDVLEELVAALLRAERHAEAVLRRVLEKGPGPSGALALLVLPEGAHAVGAAPHGGAAAAVGDDHAVAEHLGEQLHVGGLAAAGAGTAELHEGQRELGALHGVLVHEVVLRGDPVERVLPVLVEVFHGELLRLHHERVVGAHLDADRATGAVEGRQLDRVLQAAQLAALGPAGQVALGDGRGLLPVQEERADHGVRADDGAEVALRAVVRNPHGHLLGQGALLERGLPDGRLAPGVEGADREGVRGPRVDALQEHALELVHLGGVLGPGRVREAHVVLGVHRVGPGGRVLDQVQVVHCRGEGLLVRLHDLRGLLPVQPVDCGFELLARHVGREDAGQVEEGRLHDLVDALRRQADQGGDVVRVHCVELHLLLHDGPAQGRREVQLELLDGLPGAVHDEGGAEASLGEHVELRQEGGVVARDVVGARLDLVLAADRRGAEPQVRHRRGPGFLGGVVEVALGVELGPLADDGGGRLVGADRPVGSQAEEERLSRALRDGVDNRSDGQVGVPHVVDDAHRVVVLRDGAREVVEDGLHVAGGELLAAEAVVAADHLLVDARLAQGREDVRVQRQGGGEVLLRTVQHRDGLHALRHLGEEVLHRERPEEADLEEAHPLPPLPQVIHGLLRGLRRGAHHHDHALRLRVAVVVEELVLAPCDHGQLVHRLLNDVGDGVVEHVGGHRGLVVRLWVLAHAAHHRVLRVEPARPEVVERFPGHQAFHGGVGDGLHALDHGGRPGAVEEVDEGHRGLQAREVSHGAEVHHLLRVLGIQQGAACGPHRHDVGVVAEDGQRLPRQRAGRDVEDGRQQLARCEVHVRDHEQQALGAGKRGAERPARERAVQRTGRPELRLHLANLDRLPEHVLAAARRELVHRLAHARGGGDRVNE